MNALGVMGFGKVRKRKRQWNSQIHAPKTGMQIRRRPGEVLPHAMAVAREWDSPHRVRGRCDRSLERTGIRVRRAEGLAPELGTGIDRALPPNALRS